MSFFSARQDGIASLSTSKPIQSSDAARKIGLMRQAGRITGKEQLPGFRSVISKTYGVSGNDLSLLAALDIGGRDAIILVAESWANKKPHADLISSIENAGFRIASERFADTAVIAEINDAIGKRVAEEKSSDVLPIIVELLTKCIQENTADVHIVCREKRGMTLKRIDSKLYQHRPYSVEICEQMAGYMFTIMADPRSRSTGTFSLENKSMDCVFLFTIENQKYKIRYKYLRAYDGWDVDLRILPLDQDQGSGKTFLDLGYAESHIEQLELSVSRRIGLIVITGPTGSGKSTTLKTMMEFDPQRKFKKRYSVEDPVEYKIFGVTQISIQRDGHDVDSAQAFNAALLDILRADPDDVMVGETRDPVTAKMVADFVITGHKMYTTLHTPSAMGAVLRLHGLGIDRNVLADRQFFAAAIFQRLLPLLCKHCKQPATKALDNSKLSVLKSRFGLNTNDIFCNGNDPECTHCGGRGTSGSTVVAEIMVPDKIIRQHIANGEDDKAETYWRQSRKSDFHEDDMTGKTAFEHAIYKVSLGLIDPMDVAAEFGPLQSYEIIERGDL